MIGIKKLLEVLENNKESMGKLSPEANDFIYAMGTYILTALNMEDEGNRIIAGLCFAFELGLVTGKEENLDENKETISMSATGILAHIRGSENENEKDQEMLRIMPLIILDVIGAALQHLPPEGQKEYHREMMSGACTMFEMGFTIGKHRNKAGEMIWR